MANTENQPLYLGKDDVSTYLKNMWDHLINEIEKALESYSAGKVIQPVRSAVAVNNHNGILFTMPAYDSENDSLATKVVSMYPDNKSKGLPTIQALVLLYNAEDGKLKAIFDGEVITNMRTAAASAVATKYLAHKNSEYLAILGAGVQARSHFQALSHTFSFKKIFVWNINVDTGTKFVEELRKEGFSCELSSTVQQAVQEADIIVTVTNASKPILFKEWVKPGAHINAVGAPVPDWQELEKDLMLSSVVYVDSKAGALTESGDIIQSGATIYAEIGEVISGSKVAYMNKTTVFKSLGMAIEDAAAAELVYKNYMNQI